MIFKTFNACFSQGTTSLLFRKITFQNRKFSTEINDAILSQILAHDLEHFFNSIPLSNQMLFDVKILYAIKKKLANIF